MFKSVSKASYTDKFEIATYKDGVKWVAHNLSLDIVATDRSRSKALDLMRDLTIAQVKFAITNGIPETINHPAPARFWEMASKKMTATLIGKLAGASKEATVAVKKIFERSPIVDLDQPRRIA